MRRANGSTSNGRSSSPGRWTTWASRSTVSWAAGSAATSSNSWRWRSASTTIGSSPFFRALFRKMSANEVDRIARMPHAGRAHGACSRDEPLLAPAVLVDAPVAEERLAQGVLVGDLAIAGGHDLVGVDVLGRERDD